MRLDLTQAQLMPWIQGHQTGMKSKRKHFQARFISVEPIRLLVKLPLLITHTRATPIFTDLHTTALIEQAQ